jgi:CheY-like chemotaxis protein
LKEIINKKILLIDDNEYSTQLMADFFEFHKLYVDTESNPVNALKKIDQYDLVITDLNMREMSGIELIKNFSDYDYTMFILISGYLRPEDISELIQLKNLYSIRNKSEPLDIIYHTSVKALEFVSLKNR